MISIRPVILTSVLFISGVSALGWPFSETASGEAKPDGVRYLNQGNKESSGVDYAGHVKVIEADENEALKRFLQAGGSGGLGTCDDQHDCIRFSLTALPNTDVNGDATASCNDITGSCKLQVCLHIDFGKDECTTKSTDTTVGDVMSHVCSTVNEDGCQNDDASGSHIFAAGTESPTCPTEVGTGGTQSGKCNSVLHGTKFCQQAEPGDILYWVVKDGSDTTSDMTFVDSIPETWGEDNDHETVYVQKTDCNGWVQCFSAASEYAEATIPITSGKLGCGGGTTQQQMERIWKYHVPDDYCTNPSCSDTADDTTPPPSAADPEDPVPPTPAPAGGNGDPHFKTWKNEHFEYHGQCDMILTKDDLFADGLGLTVEIRTKVIRYWSYIRNAAIMIGGDILEVEGGSDTTEPNNHYWYNLEYKGQLESIGGFPVTYKVHSIHKREFVIDLSKKYPGHKIVISTYKEFVRVDFKGQSRAAYGKTIGILGDYSTGKTVGRDGFTEVDDFTKLGHEWQVLPAEPMLFHDVAEPQYPQKCIDPEDPRGERKRRRLGQLEVTEKMAESACAHLKDAADRKDCIYDVLATQDIDMVGAY